jgi:drug/metabolite transporter (DMT)-like permease
MIEFLWCIVVTTSIGVGFKLFSRYKVNTFNAIVINYTVCLLLGSLLDPDIGLPFTKDIITSDWFWFDILLGFLFITGFNLTAQAIHSSGITLTTLMQRMSLLLTVSFTVIFFKEHFGWLEFCGLVFAVLAIVAINLKKSPTLLKKRSRFPLILIAVLAMSAAIEILLYYVEKSAIVGEQQMAFTTHGFGVAAILGWIAMGWLWITGKNNLNARDILAGTLLGIPNFFSIYLLLKMLNQGWNGSIMYPLLNVSVLLLSTLIAVFIFHEKLSKINWVGIGLATASISIIAYAHNTA